MSTDPTPINAELADYVRDHAGGRDQVLLKVEEQTAAMGSISIMQTAPEQAAFLEMLVRLTGAMRALEIGTFTGYSSLAMALAGDAKIVAADVSEEWTKVARNFWKKAGVEGRIDLRLGPGAETIAQLLKAGEAGRFDMMFIDADKSSYDTYYEGGLKLLRTGGVMLIDNVLWSGDVAKPSVKDEDTVALRALNEKIMADERVDLVMVPICDGLTMARKK